MSIRADLGNKAEMQRQLNNIFNYVDADFLHFSVIGKHFALSVP